jgi:hypothetical protein
VPLVRRGEPASIEIHWGLLGRRAQNVLSTAEAWERATRVSSDGRFYYLLAPNDAVVHSIAHSLLMNKEAESFRIGLRSFQDLAALSTFYELELDWESIRAASVTGDWAQAWRNMCYAAYRISGKRLDDAMRFGPHERLHYALCLAAIRSRHVRSGLFALARFSAREMQQIYGGRRNVVRTNICRARHLIGLARRGLRSDHE